MRWMVVPGIALIAAALLSAPAAAAPAVSCATAVGPGFAVCHAVRLTGVRPDGPAGFGPLNPAWPPRAGMISRSIASPSR